MDEPVADAAAPVLTIIGSLLAATSGALVAVQVGLWWVRSVYSGVTGQQSVLVGLLMSVGMLLLGVIMFVTSVWLLLQRHPTTSLRRAGGWAAVGFAAMAAWALGFPMLLG